MAIPSQAWPTISQERVETRRAALKPQIIEGRYRPDRKLDTGFFESRKLRAAKAVDGKKIRGAQKACEGSTPSARTTFTLVLRPSHAAIFLKYVLGAAPSGCGRGVCVFLGFRGRFGHGAKWWCTSLYRSGGNRQAIGVNLLGRCRVVRLPMYSPSWLPRDANYTMSTPYPCRLSQ